MKKQFVIIGIVAILVSVGLGGCLTQNNNENQVSNPLKLDKDTFVGTWKNTTILMTLNLFSNGTCSLFSLSGTWDIKDGKFIMKFSDGNVFTYNYVFSNNDRTLSLTSLSDNLTTVYTKQ